jgi:hypothetical protein
MNYTRLHAFSEISEIKISCRAFSTKGPRPTRPGHAGQELGRPAMACLQARRPERCDGAAPGRQERGPVGPEAHQGVTCGVSLAGDGPAAAESTAEELGSDDGGLGSGDGPAGERWRRRDGDAVSDGGGGTALVGSLPVSFSDSAHSP